MAGASSRGGIARPLTPFPLGTEIRRSAYGQNARTLALQEALCAGRNAIEGVTQDGEVLLTSIRDHQALPFADEEFDAEIRLQRLDLMAYGARCNAEFLRSPREAFVPRRGVKGLERVQRRQAAQAQSQFHDKNSGMVEKKCFAEKHFFAPFIQLPDCNSQSAASDRSVTHDGRLFRARLLSTRAHPFAPARLTGIGVRHAFGYLTRCEFGVIALAGVLGDHP
jgi:hypothetical protein